MPDKHFISLFIGSTLIICLVASFILVSIAQFRKRLNEYYIEKQSLLQANLEEGERMMNQIAKEIHDNLGQVAHLLYMTLRKSEKTNVVEEQKQLIAQAKELTDFIISNIDNISHSMNSDYIKKKGLSNIIQSDVEHIKAVWKVQCTFNYEGDITPIDPDKELIIYRIAQEAIRNILKHASATQIDILLCYQFRDFKMEITDNGLGMNVDGANNHKGLGLQNMEERAQLLNGKLNISSTPNNGCKISLYIKDILFDVN